jgi:hypothetical protein
MGKAALLYVGAAIMMMTGLYGAITRTGVETGTIQADYETQVLAREVAQSAFNMLMSGVREDYAGHRPERRYVDYRDGRFSYRAVGASSGPVLLEAVGDVLESRHRVTGKMELIRRAPIAALTFDGPLGNVTSRGTSWTITGLDDDIPSQALSGMQTRSHGVRSILEQADQAAQAEMPAAQVTGVAGVGDFVQNPGLVTFHDIVEMVDAMPASDKTVIPGPVSWNGNETFGSPSDPAVVVVEGDLTIAGNMTGYGILIVKGALDIRQNGNPVWEGLFIVESSKTTHKMLGNPQIYGAMALIATTTAGETGGEADAGMLGGHFDVTVLDGSGNVRYQAHQYDDRYDVTGVDVLRPGCGQRGLCWEDMVLNSGETQVKVDVIGGSTSFVQINGGATEAGTWIAPEAIAALTISGFGLCDLPGSTPQAVESSPSNGQTVRVTGESGTVLYTVSVYHHLVSGTCAYESVPGTYFEAVRPMDFTIGGTAKINMSSVALERLYTGFPLLASADPEYVLSNVRELAENTGTELFTPTTDFDKLIDTRDFFY